MPFQKVGKIFNRMKAIAELLLSKKINVNMCNGKGVTAFYYACSIGNIEVIMLLGSKNAC
jgi:ankyrin repeat protein